MKKYDVLLPIAGHISVQVEAESEKDAIKRALEASDFSLDDIQDWKAIEQFSKGNVCYCPWPWEAEAELAYGEEADEDAA